ncbi:MAG: hypothetical protein IPK26_22450 [Planctomycetes bacterium]|nr:hypothetical protein [Planctomycetota bacterium]
MSWFGLSPTALLIGAAVLAAVAVVLHLLRVRLRRVEVDTLLFFQLAGTVRQPRSLPGSPSRWLSLLLLLLALAAAWTALGDPRSGQDAASRLVVVEPAGGDPSRLGRVHEVVLQGLGPRGVVVAATSPPTVLLTAGEPMAVLDERHARLPASGDPEGGRAALTLFEETASSWDQLVWLGSTPPPTGVRDIVWVPPDRAADAVVTGLRWEREDDVLWHLVVEHESATPVRVELRTGEQVVASQEAVAGRSSSRLGPLAAAANRAVLRLLSSVGTSEIALPPPPTARLRIAVDGALPAAVRRAVDLLVASDPELEPVAPADAEVVVAAADRDDPRPHLVIAPGVGAAPRLPIVASPSPLALSLRDRRRASASALPPFAEAAIWVRDEGSGEALVAATANGRLRVFVVDWLLLPESHADVPILLRAALRQLGNWPRVELATEQQPIVLRHGLPGAIQIDGVDLRSDSGLTTHAFTGSGEHPIVTAAGRRTVHVLPARGPATGVVTAARPPMPALADGNGWLPVLLLVLLLAMLVDVFLFHRGRLP